MRPTRTLIGAKARKAVLDGVNSIYVPTRMTFGPQGRNALLYRTFNRGSRITNDGVTVSECQEPKNIFVRLAAAAFKEAAKRTNEKCGDGTTLTTILGGKLFNDVYSLLSEGQSEYTASKSGKVGVMTLRKKILESAAKVKEAIIQKAVKIETLEDLEKIATVSVEDANLGKVIAGMAWQVGIDGFIDVVEGYKGELETEVIKGMRFPAKVGAKAFVNNPSRYEMVAQDAHVFVTNYAMDNLHDTAGPFQAINKQASKIIIIAPSFSDNVLVNMVEATKAGFFMFPVAVPSLRTEQFDDLAVYCGAVFYDKNKGKVLQQLKFEDLGFLEKLVVKDNDAREDAVATGGAGMREQTVQGTKVDYIVGSLVEERIDILKRQRDETQQDSFKKLIDRRIASMSSAVGVIRVGDSTQASSLYRKLKIEDAVYACKAALRGGYVQGAGIALREIAETVLESDDILKQAILAPYEQIQESLGGTKEAPVEIPKEVIDPAEALLCAVDHATSVVATLATVDIITQEEESLEMGEGYVAIARSLNELSLAFRVHLGQLKASEVEVERDKYNGLTVDEVLTLDRG